MIGIQYLVTFLGLLFLGGALALVMRWELMRPGMQLLTMNGYNQVMSLHGILMLAVDVAWVFIYPTLYLVG